MCTRLKLGLGLPLLSNSATPSLYSRCSVAVDKHRHLILLSQCVSGSITLEDLRLSCFLTENKLDINYLIILTIIGRNLNYLPGVTDGRRAIIESSLTIPSSLKHLYLLTFDANISENFRRLKHITSRSPCFQFNQIIKNKTKHDFFCTHLYSSLSKKVYSQGLVICCHSLKAT